MFTTRMIQLFAVVLNRDSERVTEVLLREGVMQFINISEVESSLSEKLDNVSPQTSLAEISEMRRRIEGFLHPIGIYPDTPKEIDLKNRTPVDIAEESKRLDKLAEQRERIRERQRIVQQEVLKLEEIKRQVEIYGLGFSDVALSTRHTFISIRTGKIPTSNLSTLNVELKDVPSVNLSLGEEDNTTHLLLIFIKRDAELIKKVLDKVGWIKVELPRELSNMKTDISADLASKLSLFIKEQKKLRDEVKEHIAKESRHLIDVWIHLRVNELFYKIQSYFKCSLRTVIFSGWLPASKKERLTEKIKQASEGRCYMEWHEAEERGAEKEVAPVQFRNHRILAPFQMLVSNFGIPEYGTIDPTPFIMPIYLIMFGLMFADAGHGAVLAILGLLGINFYKKKKDKEILRNLSSLIVWCGTSSIIFGVLFGSYFGMNWFKPIWFDFHGIISGHTQIKSPVNDIFDILKITILFGITVIILGLLFNWINLFKKKQWIELILDKGGIICGWIYAGGIYIAGYMINHNYNALPETRLIFWLVGFPALLLLAKGPFHLLKHRKEGTEGKFTLLTPLNIVMEWIVELLDVFSGYLANTLSFMRVAGMGIAHVSLMISFFSLAHMAGGIGPVPILILILGNILVICLEGLCAGVQALRLNYYEFFTKFFHGTGKLYSPVSLNSRDL